MLNIYEKQMHFGLFNLEMDKLHLYAFVLRQAMDLPLT